jgi:uncharacterized protein (TIGR02757 family)
MTKLTPRRRVIAGYLETLYACYNAQCWVSPDPLQFLYRYERPEDREIAALIASSLAYGRVAMILRNAGTVLDVMGQSPRAFVEQGSLGEWQDLFHGFRHRFTDGSDVAFLLDGVQRVIHQYGSLGGCLALKRREAGSLAGALDELVKLLAGGRKNSLLCRPSQGSACKRHFLMLRWMVRHDDVDPGGWDRLNPAELLVPLDTHMYQVCRSLGFTRRRAADLKTTEEISQVFALMRPDDPVRYDFVITRFGIRPDMDQNLLIDECRRRSRAGCSSAGQRRKEGQ